jgi:RNA polymerase sigma-70 factor (ECF subfamily)
LTLTETADSTLERAKAGDPAAFQALVRPHVDSIRRFARSFCKNEVDADDLAQDAIVKAYRSFSSFDGRSSLTTWLYAIAKHQFLDYRRGKLFQWRSRETELTDGDRASQPNPEFLVVEHQQVKDLWTALNRIDEKFRTPLVLADIDGLSYEEIAEIEKIPIGTVRSRIARAKDQLRKLLGVPTRDHHESSEGTAVATTASHPLTKGLQ